MGAQRPRFGVYAAHSRVRALYPGDGRYHANGAEGLALGIWCQWRRRFGANGAVELALGARR